MEIGFSPTPQTREATKLALARHLAFNSMTAAAVAFLVALALDFTSIVPLLAGQDAYNPIRQFLSYQVVGQSGQIMTGVFLLLAVSAWSYAAAAYLAPSRPSRRLTLAATVLFGAGVFLGACFRAVPAAEIQVARYLRADAWLHNIGIGGGFAPAALAAFLDQRRIVFGRIPGYALTKLSFWLVLGGGVATALAMLVFHGIAGLSQRIFVSGIVLWLATEAHQLFWTSAHEALAMPPTKD